MKKQHSDNYRPEEIETVWEGLEHCLKAIATLHRDVVTIKKTLKGGKK